MESVSLVEREAKASINFLSVVIFLTRRDVCVVLCISVTCSKQYRSICDGLKGPERGHTELDLLTKRHFPYTHPTPFCINQLLKPTSISNAIISRRCMNIQLRMMICLLFTMSLITGQARQAPLTSRFRITQYN